MNGTKGDSEQQLPFKDTAKKNEAAALLCEEAVLKLTAICAYTEDEKEVVRAPLKTSTPEIIIDKELLSNSELTTHHDSIPSPPGDSTLPPFPTDSIMVYQIPLNDRDLKNNVSSMAYPPPPPPSPGYMLKVASPDTVSSIRTGTAPGSDPNKSVQPGTATVIASTTSTTSGDPNIQPETVTVTVATTSTTSGDPNRGIQPETATVTASTTSTTSSYPNVQPGTAATATTTTSGGPNRSVQLGIATATTTASDDPSKTTQLGLATHQLQADNREAMFLTPTNMPLPAIGVNGAVSSTNCDTSSHHFISPLSHEDKDPYMNQENPLVDNFDAGEYGPLHVAIEMETMVSSPKHGILPEQNAVPFHPEVRPSPESILITPPTDAPHINDNIAPPIDADTAPPTSEDAALPTDADIAPPTDDYTAPPTNNYLVAPPAYSAVEIQPPGSYYPPFLPQAPVSHPPAPQPNPQPTIVTQQANANQQDANPMMGEPPMYQGGDGYGFANAHWGEERDCFSAYLPFSIVMMVLCLCNPTILVCAIPALIASLMAIRSYQEEYDYDCNPRHLSLFCNICGLVSCFLECTLLLLSTFIILAVGLTSAIGLREWFIQFWYSTFIRATNVKLS